MILLPALLLLAPSGGVDVSLEAKPLRARVGDRVEIRLAVRREADVEIEWPDLALVLASFRVKGEETATREEGGRVVEERRLVLLPTRPGTVEIPPQAVRFRRGEAEGVRTTEPLRLEIDSVLAEGETELRATRGPLEPPAPRWPWAVGALAGTLALFLLARLLRRKVLAPKPVPPPVPPHLRALRSLEALEARSLDDGGAVGLFYDEVSAVVRVYIEGRFGLRAPERTTEEFLEEASADGLFTLDLRLLLREFLEACDLVKFARHRPGEGEVRGALGAARRFVEETRPDRVLEGVGALAR